jgi:broad specificity phosphatase PhoE
VPNELLTWPRHLYIVRHGESAGNVARDQAEAARLHVIDIAGRDVDVPLSPLGEQQADAVGRSFAAAPEEMRPNIALTSPYLRARDTTTRLLAAAGLTGIETVIDERLREKEFGILDRLTKIGIEQKYPDQAEFRRVLGKFYYRPPGGESWCDVILRLRSLTSMIAREYNNERVLIVAHQVVVHGLRYLLEHMTEEEILASDRAQEIANCSVTSYEFDPLAGKKGKLVPRLFNFVAPLEATGIPITTRRDVPVAAK